MRNRAAALLILTLTTSCSRAPRHDQRSPTPPTTQHPPTTTIAVAPTTSVPPASVATPSKSIGSQPTPSVVVTDSSTVATRVVDQLIAGLSAGTVPDADLWSGVVAGGRVIQTTVLAESAERATVAVSIAFEPTPGETDIEPIGLRVELLHAPDHWDVIAIGYL